MAISLFSIYSGHGHKVEVFPAGLKTGELLGLLSLGTSTAPDIEKEEIQSLMYVLVAKKVIFLEDEK